MQHEAIVVLDFGSQVTQLIARRIREAGVFCEILPCTAPIERILANSPQGIVLSGGPASVYAKGAPTVDTAVYQSGLPVLGICYGMQLTAHLNGGEVQSADEREFGRTMMNVQGASTVICRLTG